jgi:hypothetical protein
MENSEMDMEEKNNIVESEEIILKQNELKQLEEDIETKKAKFNDFINNEKQKLESEKNKLKKSLIAQKLNHKTKLEEEKVKILAQLKDEFLESIKDEYNNVNQKLDELTQKELKLIEWNKELERKQKTFNQEKELFESQKEKLLNEHKQDLEQKKEIFINKQEEEKLKKIEEINQKIENLYKEKEEDIENKENSLIQKESGLKIRENDIKAKEKYLEEQEKSLYNEAKDRVENEIKLYKQKLENNEKLINELKDDNFNLRDELDSSERFEGRDLVQELNDKKADIKRLEDLLDKEQEDKNYLKIQKDKDFNGFEQEKNNLVNENKQLKLSNMDTESLRTDKTKLEAEKEFNLEYIEILKGEKRLLKEKLDAIYDTVKEKEEREKAIKTKVYQKLELQNEITIKDEVEYLDSIARNMKEYGVEYPKRLLYSFHTALKSADFSPLSVLSGVSGTGKSELPKLYSHFGGFNFLSEAVQPTWDSPESMMGYYNTIENKFDSTNILRFLLQASQGKSENQFGWKDSMNMILLDEMNLSHIELYFAEFLSKFEQRRGRSNINLDIKLGAGMIMNILLDTNTLWIGTMNEDETTKSLSDKVLDRAFSINFPRPNELKSRNNIKKLEEIKQFEYLHRDTWNSWIKREPIFDKDNIQLINRYKDITNKINKELSTTGKAIGHRVWQSMEFYIQNHPLVIKNINDEKELERNVKLAYEEQLVQKVMPKLRGIETHGKENDVLQNISNILNSELFTIIEDFENSRKNPYGQFIWNSADYLTNGD